MLEQNAQTVELGIVALTQKEEIVLSSGENTVEFVKEHNIINEWLNSSSKATTLFENENKYIETVDDNDVSTEMKLSEETSKSIENSAVYLLSLIHI